MKNLHFTQVNKNWFYTFNSSDKAITFTPPTSNSLNDWIALTDVHSKSQAVNILKAKFPENKPIYTIYNVETSKKTPFQKKGMYRDAERRFKDRQDETSITEEEFYNEENSDEEV